MVSIKYNFDNKTFQNKKYEYWATNLSQLQLKGNSAFSSTELDAVRNALTALEKNKTFNQATFQDMVTSLNLHSTVDPLPNSKKVVVLGKVGMGPWGAAPGFLNQNAKWIWFTKNANTSAPGNANASFIYRWYNTSSSNMSAKINIIADNKSGITVNGKSVGEQSGGWGGSGGLFKVTLEPGTNDFIFNAANVGSSPNPAGLLVTVVNENNKVLFSTGDNGWRYVSTFTSVYTLGQAGMKPWGAVPGFLNQKAKWIWFTKGANTSAPAGANAYFEYTWNNTSSSSISAKINIIADDEASVIVNDETIGTQRWMGGSGII